MKKFKFILCLLTSLSLMSFPNLSVNADDDYSNSTIEATSANICGADALSNSNYTIIESRFSTRATDPTALATIYDNVDIVDTSYWGTSRVDVYGTCSTTLLNYVSGTEDGIPDWTLMVMCQLYVSNASSQYTNSPTKSVYNGTYVSTKTKTVQGKDFGWASATGYHTVKDYSGNIIWDNETYKSEGI